MKLEDILKEKGVENIHSIEMHEEEVENLTNLAIHMLHLTGLKAMYSAISEGRIDLFSAIVASRKLSRALLKVLTGNEHGMATTVALENIMNNLVERHQKMLLEHTGEKMKLIFDNVPKEIEEDSTYKLVQELMLTLEDEKKKKD